MPVRPRVSRHLSWLAASLLLAATAHASADTAGGSVHLEGGAWAVVDGIAWHQEGGVEVAFTDAAFDRAAMREEGGIDELDVMRHSGNRLGLRLEGGEPPMCLHFTTRSGDTIRTGSSCNDAFAQALEITTLTAERIAGRMQWGEVDGEHLHVAFDLAIEPAAVPAPELAGEPLPPDGGAPGEALLAHFDALVDGDWARYKAGSHPERRVMLEEQEAAGEHQQMFGFLQSYAPRDVRITGGTRSGDSAQLTYIGVHDGAPVKGEAELVRDQGTWYVVGTMTE